eukprot:1493991-Rhodomonas_salina.1
MPTRGVDKAHALTCGFGSRWSIGCDLLARGSEVRETHDLHPPPSSTHPLSAPELRQKTRQIRTFHTHNKIRHHTKYTTDSRGMVPPLAFSL